MADRRAFSRSLLQSDAFMDMPYPAQCLYIHLCLGADDDGFINGAKGICRGAGCSNDDLSCLIDRGFIIPFGSGPMFVAHWAINNGEHASRKKRARLPQDSLVQGRASIAESDY